MKIHRIGSGHRPVKRHYEGTVPKGLSSFVRISFPTFSSAQLSGKKLAHWAIGNVLQPFDSLVLQP
jgi:hypothetical protein